MAAYIKFQPFVENLAEKVFNLGSDVLKLLLTLTAPAATDGQKSQLTEIAAGNGYTAGGNTVTISSSAQVGGTYKLVGADSSWTATPAAIANFRYAVLYDDTAANDELIGHWDYAATLTLTAGNTFTVDFDASNGILQIT